MACHTLSECARLTNKSRRTIQRYVKSGKLSAKKDRNKNPVVETSELMRVFGQLSHPADNELSQLVTGEKTESLLQSNTNLTLSDLEAVISDLKTVIDESNKAHCKQIEELKEEIRSLKRLTFIPGPEEENELPGKTSKPLSTDKNQVDDALNDIPNLSDYFNKK